MTYEGKSPMEINMGYIDQNTVRADLNLNDYVALNDQADYFVVIHYIKRIIKN